MGRLGNEDNRRQNQLMTFTVGNEEVKLSPAIVKNYLVIKRCIGKKSN